VSSLLDIIVVNWNVGDLLAGVVTSIVRYHHNLVSSIIIVDNASTDDSLMQVEAIHSLPCQLTIIRNRENRGFAAACNQGAALATSDFLLFLNPDTRLFENSLPKPLEYLQLPENSSIAIVGIQLIDENNQITRSCSRFPTLGIFITQALGINRLSAFQHLSQAMTEWQHTDTRQVDQVIGAFTLIRSSVFTALGGFDERFFVYFEEVDLSLRARQAGWRSVFCAQAQAFHAGGGASQQVKSHRIFYSIRSRLLYGFKHFKPWQAWTLLCVSLILESISRMVFSVMRGAPRDMLNTLSAFGMLFRDVPNILKKAHQS
jgi:GT2 family glycosyltransferase